MALVLLEGFDHEATTNFTEGGPGNQMTMKGWSVNDTFGYTPGRFPYGPQSRGIRAAIINNGTGKVLPSTYSQLIVGFGWQYSGGSNHAFFDIHATGGTTARLFLVTGGYIQIVDSTGATIATGTTQLSINTWYYIEVKVVKGVSGTCEVRLNGVPGEIPAATGNYGTTNINEISWEWQQLGAQSTTIDDVYALDPTTGTNTDFLGDIVVETLYPVSDGTYTQWTPDTGSTHYTRVDEGQLDGDTSYVHTTTTSAKDSYGIGSPTLTNTTVYGVQLNLGARKNDAGGRTIKPLIRQSSTDYFGPLSSLTAAYQFYSWLLDQDPSGSNWTYTTVNTDEYGIELVS